MGVEDKNYKNAKYWLVSPDGAKTELSNISTIEIEGDLKMYGISVSQNGGISINGSIWYGIPTDYYTTAIAGNETTYGISNKKETSEELTKRLSSELTDLAIGHFKDFLINQFYPTRIIYNPPYTICYFGDEKVIVKCSEFDEFKPDFGVMACIMRRMFSTRAEFDRLVESGSWQEPKEKKNK